MPQYTKEEVKELLRGSSDDQINKMYGGIIAQQEGRGERSAPSTLRKLEAGYSSIGRATGIISNYLTDQVKEHFANKYVEDATEEIAKKGPPQSEFEAALNEEYMAGVKRQQKEVAGANMHDYKLEKKLAQYHEYPDVWGTEYQDSAPYLVGKFSNYLIDETSLIPIPAIKGASIGFQVAKPTLSGVSKAATSASVGGAVVGLDNAAWQMYEKGQINADELAMWTAGGAVFVPLITLGGKGLSSWISGRISGKTKVNPDEVGEALNKYLKNPDHDAHIEAFLIHTRTNLRDIAPKVANHINRQIDEPIKKNLSELLDEKLGVTGHSITLGKKGQLVKKGTPKTKAEKSARAKQARELAKPGTTIWKRRGAEKLVPHVDQRMYARELARAILNQEEHAIRLSRTAKEGSERAKQMDKAWKERAQQLSEIDEMTEMAYKAADEMAEKTLKETARTVRKLSQDLSKLEARKKVNVPDEYVDDMDVYLEEAIDNVQRQVDELTAATGFHPKELQARIDFHQGGFVSNQLMQHFGTAVAGGVIGGMVGEGEGAAMGFMAGLAGSVALTKNMKTDSTLKALRKLTAEDTAMQSSLNRWAIRPRVMLRAMGPLGATMAKKFEMADINMNMMAGKANVLFERALKPVKDLNLGPQFIRAMQGVERLAQQPKEIQDAVRETRRIMNSVLKAAETHGVITKAQKRAMMADKSYWPRVYNQMFLNSKEGQEMWIKKFSDEGHSNKKVLEKMVESITGKGFDQRQHFEQIMRNPKTGKYHISADFAKELYRQRSKDSITNRATHLEHERKIHLEEEDFLNEFMIEDPSKTMANYFHDSYKRIAFAKEFGANDEVANKFMDHLVKEGKEMEHEYFKDLYYAAVGNEHSSIIKNQVRMSETERNILGSVNAFETLKLTAAQVLNLTQATVNGITYANKLGHAKVLPAYIDGLKSIFSKEGREFAMQSGAAVETTFMQLVAEANSHATIMSALGKTEFKGALAPLDWLNNPSKFLKGIGFISLEKSQRTLASNMGKSFAKDLIAKRSKLEGMTPQPKILKKIKEINKSLDELNIPSSLSADEIMADIHHLDRAAQTFSNKVNHTNSIDQLPLAWRGPYARTFLKFKSFAFHQAAFIQDNVMQPALNGNLKPLIAYLGVGGLGMSTDEIRRMVRSDDKKLTMTERYLRGLTAVGGAGIMWDGAINFATNPSAASAWSFIGGPAVGDVHKVTTGAYEAFTKSDPRALAGDVYSTIGGSYPFKNDIKNLITGD